MNIILVSIRNLYFFMNEEQKLYIKIKLKNLNYF